MKTILIPTDFSVYADNAIRYACGFNKVLKAKIILFHSYHIPIATDEYSPPGISFEDLKEISIQKLKESKARFEMDFPEAGFEIEASIGLASDVIEDAVKRHDVDLIIMGTHGASGLRELLMGSITASVMENSSVPVLAIPEDAVFRGMENIVYALDHGQHNVSRLHKIVAFARLFESEIILLHFSKEAVEGILDDSRINQFRNHVMRDTNYLKFTTRLIEDEDVFLGLNAYLDQFKPDLVALNMRHRNFFEKIFSRSLTKRMAYHSHVPVLALHDNH